MHKTGLRDLCNIFRKMKTVVTVAYINVHNGFAARRKSAEKNA